MYCYNCGNKIDDQVNFCPSCGFSQKKSNEIKGEKNEGKTFVKRTKAEIDDLGEIVKSSSVGKKVDSSIENLKSSKESVTYFKKESTKAYYGFLEVIGYFSVLILSSTIIAALTLGSWVITNEWHEFNRAFFSHFIPRITIPIILPLIFVYLGFRHKRYKDHSVGIWLFFTFLTIILLLTMYYA